MFRTSLPVHTGRTAPQKVLFLTVFFAALCFVPYLITPPLTISRSYVAGFSNRTAVILFLLGMGLFALFTGGELSPLEDKDSRLSIRALAAGLFATLLACISRCHLRQLRVPGGECVYFLNRQQMLAAGRTPYRQFEFGYGPLLLYPSLWTQRLLHTSILGGYVLTWIAECLLGTIMIWAVVRLLDLRIPSRIVLFAFLLASQLIWVDRGGLSYTAFRAFSAAFCIAITHAVWKTTRNPWYMALCCIGSVVFSMACSVDQAIGVAFGLNAYMLLLAFHRSWKFPAGSLALSIAGSLACFAAANHWGMLLTLKSFGTGGYSYPLLPSPSILLALFAYVAAGCIFYQMLAQKRLDSMVLPLTLGGIAMIPAALSRCDILHITGATSIFVVGVAAICCMPVVRGWWLGLALVGLIALPPTFTRKDAIFAAVSRWAPPLRAWSSRESEKFVPSQNQAYLSEAALPESAYPCDRSYFSPSLMPKPVEPFRLQCLDTGYYLGFTNVATLTTINDKLDELRRHANEPLLLENKTLDEQIFLQMATVDSLHVESGSFWVPRLRNAPLTYAPIITYIRTHYVPGPLAAQGHLRIWIPRQVQ
jgi:hypothetical protein